MNESLGVSFPRSAEDAARDSGINVRSQQCQWSHGHDVLPVATPLARYMVHRSALAASSDVGSGDGWVLLCPGHFALALLHQELPAGSPLRAFIERGLADRWEGGP